jgi:predicted ABC-type sugar transport system permease subunit
MGIMTIRTAVGSENNWLSSITKLGDFWGWFGNYAAINWFIVGCFFFLIIISTVTNSKTKFSIYFINSILPLNYVVILTNPLVVAYYSFMSIGELEMGVTDADM